MRVGYWVLPGGRLRDHSAGLATCATARGFLPLWLRPRGGPAQAGGGRCAAFARIGCLFLPGSHDREVPGGKVPRFPRSASSRPRSELGPSLSVR